MATRANKFTVHVTPSRHQQTMSIRASGRFGKTSLIIPPTYQANQVLSSATDAKTYWNAVLVLAQAMVLSM
jgi:hypothetical protein